MNDWVNAFYNDDVGFDPNRIEGDGNKYSPPLDSYFERFLHFSRDSNGPCILPILAKNKYVELILSAPTQEQSSELHSISRAYFGSAYAIVGSSIISNSNEPSYSKVLKNFPGGIVRIRIKRGADRQEQYFQRVYAAMNLAIRMVEQYKSRPLNLSTVRRPTGRMLQDFFAALRDRKRDEVSRLYDELSDSNCLSARNLRFLEFNIYSSFREWDSILSHPQLGDVISARVPRSVATAFLAAIDALLIPQGSLDLVNVGEFRNRVRDALVFFLDYPGLDRNDTSVRLWRTWSIGAAIVQNYEGVNQIEDLIGPDWTKLLGARFGFAPSTKKVDGKREDDLQFLLGADETYETALAMLQYAIKASDTEHVQIAESLKSYPEDVLKKINIHWQRALGLADSTYSINGWTQWFQKMKSKPESEELLRIAIENNEYWEATTWSESEFIEVIENSGLVSVVRNILPMLLTWLEENRIQLSNRSLEPLMLSLAVDIESDFHDISIGRDLIEILVGQAHSGDDYRSMLEALGEIWDKVKSKSALPKAYELFDLLLDSPCQNPSARDALWQKIQSYMLSDWQRLEFENKIIGKKLAEELVGSSDHFGIDDQDEDSIQQEADFNGKSLAIYTLFEKAAVRAKTILEELYPGIKISVNHDHEATSALNNLAKKSDYFIFSSQAAKHQAFYPVTKLRNDIVYPEGKGTTSIVRAFIDKVAKAA